MIAICLKVEVVLTRLLKHIIFLREKMEYSRMSPSEKYWDHMEKTCIQSGMRKDADKIRNLRRNKYGL